MKALKRIFGSKIKEVTEGWTIWHNGELYFVLLKTNQGGCDGWSMYHT
jgi:hypothetical protein